MNFHDYKAYHQSITAEMLASRNRVRHFINGRHYGEDGRYKEILLMNYLKKVLPSNVSVGTGFVKNNDRVTKQIDIIVYDQNIPTLFSEGDFVIVLPESVIGIIEVKSRLSNSNLYNAIKTAHINGEIVEHSIFNGIFSYENNVRLEGELRDGAFSARRREPINIRLKEVLIENNSRINHISFGPNKFMKFWEAGNPIENDSIPCYSFYEIENLSFGFFVSNLIEYIYARNNLEISNSLSDFLYPTQKEIMRIEELEVKLNLI